VKPPALALFETEPVIAPDGLGRRAAKMWQPFMPTACRDHREPAGTRPVHQFADQRRLVAIGKRIHHPCLVRSLSEQRTAKSVGLHRYVDDMLTMGNYRQAVIHRCDGVTGAFNDHVDTRGLYDALPVVRDRKGVA